MPFNRVSVVQDRSRKHPAAACVFVRTRIILLQPHLCAPHVSSPGVPLITVADPHLSTTRLLILAPARSHPDAVFCQAFALAPPSGDWPPRRRKRADEAHQRTTTKRTRDPGCYRRVTCSTPSEQHRISYVAHTAPTPALNATPTAYFYSWRALRMDPRISSGTLQPRVPP